MAVSDDFPRERMPAVVSGVQTKMGVVLSHCCYVLQSEEQRAERYDICEDLAHRLLPKALSDAAKHPGHTSAKTLERVRKAVGGKGWVSPAELLWLMQRLCVLLDW